VSKQLEGLEAEFFRITVNGEQMALAVQYDPLIRRAIAALRESEAHYHNMVAIKDMFDLWIKQDNARLRAACDQFQKASAISLNDADNLEADNARLRARLATMVELLRVAVPWLDGIEAAAILTDNQHNNDASGEALDAIRGLNQQVGAAFAQEDRP